MNSPYVRIKAGKKYCSGVFISSDFYAKLAPSQLILTCAHFWRNLDSTPRVTGVNASIVAVREITNTDLALVVLDAPGRKVYLPQVGGQKLLPGRRIITYGFGGKSNRAVPKPGRYLIPIPFAISRNFSIRVRKGFLALSPAIKGDSGGPVIHHGVVTGVQSLVLDPLGFNLHIATLAGVDGHLPALRAASTALLKDQKGC